MPSAALNSVRWSIGLRTPGTPANDPSRKMVLLLGWFVIGRYIPILATMRRREGELIAIEHAILAGGIELAAAGEPGFYGFGMARQLRDASGARRLTAHGTLYKALARLERAGMLTSCWEDPGFAESEGRPRRRLYRVTPSGE